MNEFSQFLLGVLAGGTVSIPLGPFGIWALHVYMREGRGSAIAVALGGMLGDVCVLIAYLVVGQILARLFSIDLELGIQDFFGNGIVRGLALCGIGIFLGVSACREHRPGSKLSRFWTSFAGAINPINVPAIGYVLSRLGIEGASMHGYEMFAFTLVGFSAGCLATWLFGMWAFSHLGFLRRTFEFFVFGLRVKHTVLAFLLFATGIGFFFVGIGYLASAA